MSNFRIMIVDDYELWRRHVERALHRSHKFQLVGEASDAAEAVQHARLLRPDLILMDVGLPGEDGIQTARRILADTPDVKILFLSEHQSPEIVAAAMATGASGYLIKSNAGRELLPAMSAAVETKRCHHAAAFYADETTLADDYAAFAQAALRDGAAMIVVGTASRREKLERTLAAHGVDVERVTAEGRHRWLNVEDALASVMVDGWPDVTRFSKVMTSVVAEATARSTAEPRRVVAWGECAPTLLNQGNAEAAIRVEQLWDELARRHHIETLCGYSTNRHADEKDDPVIQQICQIHSVVR